MVQGMENGVKHRNWTVEQKGAAVERLKSCGHDKALRLMSGAFVVQLRHNATDDGVGQVHKLVVACHLFPSHLSNGAFRSPQDIFRLHARE